MTKIDKISVALPHEMVADIKAAVEGGEYASASEVVREALRGWRLRRRVDAMGLEELKSLVQPALIALERGEGVDADEVFERMRIRYGAKGPRGR